MNTSLIARFFLPAVVVLAAGAQTRTPEPPPSPGVLVLGASASQGFELGKFLGESKDARRRIAATLGREPEDAEFTARTHSIGLASLLTELRTAAAAPIADAADMWMFLGPERAAKKQIRQALACEANLVLALDFMFWFGYGSLTAEEAADPAAARLARQRRALDLLDGLLADPGLPSGCRWIVGDYPDCRDAAKEMISEAMRPDAAVLRQLNATLREWAKKHANVRIFALGELLDQMRAGKVVGSDERHQVTEQEALQFDRLHPTRFGMTILVRQLSTFVQAEFPGLPELAPSASIAGRLAAGS